MEIYVESNSPELIESLADYFGEPSASAPSRARLHVLAIEAARAQFPFELKEWPRAAGSTPKEAFVDMADGRLVRKLRTGMQFLSTPADRIAVGPCLRNLNQVINFIIAQYTLYQRHAGWAVCHAAGVADAGSALGIAAHSGLGKSTLALHLVSSGLDYVSNDRLLVRQSGQGAEVAGVPKLPRVNPGTLLHNPDLAHVLPRARRAELEKLGVQELWDFEEKYDVVVERVFGSGRRRDTAPLGALVVLNWAPQSVLPTRFTVVQLRQRPDLLALLIKAPGVFDWAGGGKGVPVHTWADPQDHVELLSRVPIVEVTGRADFPLAVAHCRWLLLGRARVTPPDLQSLRSPDPPTRAPSGGIRACAALTVWRARAADPEPDPALPQSGAGKRHPS
jgi:HprK-related kinase B